MSQLIQMRQRIKAIETIKKVTQAMRIISMSTHTRLKRKVENVEKYQQEIISLFSLVKNMFPKWTNPFLQQKTKKSKDNNLIIVIASQKGLAGTFNSNLFKFFSSNEPTEKCDSITVGKKANNFISKTKHTQIKTYPSLTTPLVQIITDEIFEIIMQTSPAYTNVTVYANISRGFFSQKPQTYQLIPFDAQAEKLPEIDPDDYMWEEKPENILNFLASSYLKTVISQLLYQSLLAEHAARFISMDSATQSAENMLTDMTLSYNKIRQAKITRELTNLSASFQMD
ncbi:F0F1 ATP synthase subunit gamma [bacterium]|jgi:F-type H+-transporting ATPase subunit gamma|nr:F0F1 ATP synthase subunit gamma [bacterium]